ncbi:MAG: ATP-binding cassette domain-containing protein, partial [Asgard group archaeon]|nr:ATP-binding cassette domain-containing protein [Asgard group archaeon]
MAKTYSKTKDCPETSDELVICMKDIAVAYQSTVAIFDINLDVYKNEFLGICGPNGSGKSTLLKTMVGVLKPFRGKVRVFGRNIIKDTQMTDLRVRLGYLPQLEAIDRNFPALVKDVVAMGLYAQKGLFKRLDENDEEKIYQAL